MQLNADISISASATHITATTNMCFSKLCNKISLSLRAAAAAHTAKI
jgi:hypothetical protein